MIQKVFAVRDGKAKGYLQPFYSINAGSAIRAFEDVINETGNQLSKHPEDYVLYELADFNDQTGEFINATPVKMLGAGVDFVKSKPIFQLPEVPEGVLNGSKKS